MFGIENRLEFTQSKVNMNNFCVTRHITIIAEGKHYPERMICCIGQSSRWLTGRGIIIMMLLAVI